MNKFLIASFILLASIDNVVAQTPLPSVAWGNATSSILETIQTKTSNYTLLTTDSGKRFDNTGATGEVDFTLPTYSAGLSYCFTVTAVQTLKIIAPTSNKIAFATTNSASAGNISANAVYASICIYATSVSNQWAVSNGTGGIASSGGTWTVN